MHIEVSICSKTVRGDELLVELSLLDGGRGLYNHTVSYFEAKHLLYPTKASKRGPL